MIKTKVETKVKIIKVPCYWPEGIITLKESMIEINKLARYISNNYEVVNSQSIAGPEFGEIIYILKKVEVL